MSTNKILVDRAIAIARGGAALVRATDGKCRHRYVWYWLSGREAPNADLCLEIEQASGGEVTAGVAARPVRRSTATCSSGHSGLFQGAT